MITPTPPLLLAASFFANPLFGVAVTVLAYVIGSHAHGRFRWAHSLVVTCGLLVLLLLLCRIPYQEYNVGGSLVSFFLGPATVALGAPLYKRARQIRQHLGAVVASVAAGSAAGMLSSIALVAAVHGSKPVLLSMIPKSVTTPISMEVSRMLGGIPELTAVLTVLAGLLGSVFGPAILHLLRISGDIPLGLAIGTSSHGIGTARMVRHSELAAGVSGLSMALAGILTSLMAVPLKYLIH